MTSPHMPPRRGREPKTPRQTHTDGPRSDEQPTSAPSDRPTPNEGPYATGGQIPPDADLSGVVKRGCPIQLPTDPDDRDAFLRLFAEEFHAFQPRIVLTAGQEPRP